MCPDSVNKGPHSSSSWMKGLSVALSSAARYASASSLVRWIETVIVLWLNCVHYRMRSATNLPIVCHFINWFKSDWVICCPTSLIIMPRMPCTCFSLHYETKRSSLITVLLPLVILLMLCYLFLLTSLYIFDLVT